MSNLAEAESRGDSTRRSLIQAGLEVFGREGFHAASTRSLSDAAGVNQAAIGFHFGGKEGLYLAVFEHIAERMRARIGPIAAEVMAVLQAGEGGAPDASALYLEALGRLTDAMIEVMTRDESQSWARLIMQEQQAPTAAFDRVFEGFMGRVLTVLTVLVSKLRPDRPEPDSKLAAITILGQVLAFRAARAGILRHMGWTEIGADEVARIKVLVRANVAAQIES